MEDTMLGVFKNEVHSSNRTMSYDWLDTFVSKWLQNEDNPIPSHEKMIDCILDRLLNRLHWRKALWSCAIILNRINCSWDDPLFTRVKSVIVALLSSPNVTLLPQNVAEIEVIRNHLSLHLEPDQVLELHPTLEELSCTLEHAYNMRKFKQNSLHPSWASLVDNVTSKTSFEHIYLSDYSLTGKPPSIFWVGGKSAPIQPPPLSTICSYYSDGPQKVRHPDDNVINVKNIIDVREGFKMFVDHFFCHIESPEMTPRLMRSIILITIDLLDVALTHGVDSVNDLFGNVGCGKNMREPNLFSRGLFMLWVWAGTMSNPFHELTFREVTNIKRIKDKVLPYVSADGSSPERREEVLAVIQRIKRNAVEGMEREDFHSFLDLFAKYYPRQGRKECQREPPMNELEYVFLNIRLEFGNSSACYFHSYFRKRLRATSRRYCSRGCDYLSKNARKKEMACMICDSSSEEEDENHDDDDCVIIG